jgi:hypothetical protein
MVMKFRKISTMFFKRNYGFLFFSWRLCHFAPKTVPDTLAWKVRFSIFQLNVLLSHSSYIGVLSFLCFFLIFIYFVMSVAPQNCYPKRLNQSRYPMIRIQKFHVFPCLWKFEIINKKISLKKSKCFNWSMVSDRDRDLLLALINFFQTIFQVLLAECLNIQVF